MFRKTQKQRRKKQFPLCAKIKKKNFPSFHNACKKKSFSFSEKKKSRFFFFCLREIRTKLIINLPKKHK